MAAGDIHVVSGRGFKQRLVVETAIPGCTELHREFVCDACGSCELCDGECEPTCEVR